MTVSHLSPLRELQDGNVRLKRMCVDLALMHSALKQDDAVSHGVRAAAGPAASWHEALACAHQGRQQLADGAGDTSLERVGRVAQQDQLNRVVGLLSLRFNAGSSPDDLRLAAPVLPPPPHESLASIPPV